MKSQGDEFLLEGFNNKRGYYSVEALAFFLPTSGVVPSAPPPGGWNNWRTDVDHMSKGLPFTCVKCPPAFALPAPASLVRRTFSAYFCCCPEKPTISVHANAVSGRCK